MAVAGTVAEGCWKGWDFDQIAVALEYDPEAMSESDWALAGCTKANADVDLLKAAEAIFSLLEKRKGALWPDLLREARRLILESRFYLNRPIELDC